MKRIRVEVALLSILIALGCRDLGPSPVDLSDNVLTDTISYLVTPGIALRIEGFRDTYGLDEPVTGFIRLTNTNDTVPLILFTPSRPPHGMMIYPLGSEQIVYFYPSAHSFAEFRDTLRIGDTLSSNYIWGHETWNTTAMRWTSLKAFSGTYKLGAWLGGNSLLRRDLTKFITISEVGEPLSAYLRVDRSNADSVRADFIIRNRVNRTITLDPIEGNPITMAFVHLQDTLVALRYPLIPGTRNLSSRSDNVILHFSAAKEDSVFAPLKGFLFFDMRAVLNLKSRQIVASGFN